MLISVLFVTYAAGQKPAYTIRRDGSCNITGTAVTIANSYPVIDNKMLKALKIIHYQNR